MLRKFLKKMHLITMFTKRISLNCVKRLPHPFNFLEGFFMYRKIEKLYL